MSKFGNKKVTIDGITFDSKKEANRYQELLLMQRAGLISNLLRQQVFKLSNSVILGGRRMPSIRYTADFTYFDSTKGGEFVVEDVKGFRTKEYRMKRILMKDKHGIEVLET